MTGLLSISRLQPDAKRSNSIRKHPEGYQGWRVVSEPQLALPESVRVPEGGDWVGAGNGFVALGEVLRPLLETRLLRIDATIMPDAAAMAPLAAQAFERGEGMDAALAAPIYLRDKVALTVKERRKKQSA